MPGHAAALVHLPGYRKARTFLTFDGESGWVWAEATGRRNPLGWLPQKALQGQTIAFEIEVENFPRKPYPKGEVTQIKRRRRSIIRISPFFLIVFIMFIVPTISRVFLVTLRRKRN